MKPINKTHVVVGMSGGVDSSLSAVLLAQQGYIVHGAFMQNWEDDDEFCTARQDYKDALAVCQGLGISLQTINFAREYWDKVFAHFLEEYASGRTPNPDILCNKEIKFNAFLHWAKDQGADYIATGHYARVRHQDQYYQLLRGIDNNKDQSYFLYTLGQEALSQCLFPIGDTTKDKVRALAKEHGLHVYSKKDSTGICFIGERKFNDFLSEYLPNKPGNIVTDKGKAIGTHQGLMYYTLGQRQGLGIGGRKDSKDGAWYVIGKNMDRNELVVAQGHDHPKLYYNTLYASQIYWVRGEYQQSETSFTAKVRYRQQDVPCNIQILEDNKLRVHFDNAVRAITPGQAVVLYQNETCLGGATIDSICNE